MDRIIDSVEARSNFNKMLREVESQRRQFVVERNGEPIAAVVPIELYRQWQRQRDAFFDRLEQIAQRADVPEDEAMQLALEEQRAVRAGT